MKTNYDVWVEARTKKFHDTNNIEGFIAEYSNGFTCRRCPVLDDCLVGSDNNENVTCKDTLTDYAYKEVK